MTDRREPDANENPYSRERIRQRLDNHFRTLVEAIPDELIRKIAESKDVLVCRERLIEALRGADK